MQQPPIPIQIKPEDAAREVADINQKIINGIQTLGSLKHEDVQVGTTPKEVVYREDKLVLYRYVPVVEEKDLFKIPMLISYALVNRPNVADLQENRSLIRNLVRPEVRLPVFVLVIASFVTAVELTMQAYLYDLYLVLGLFIPLIVTNCAIIGRAEAFASKARLDKAVVDGVAMGVGFTLVLMVLGGIRELLGQGTLFYQAELLLGAGAAGFGLSLGENFQGALLAILPPGAFIGLGILVALKNVIDKGAERRRLKQQPSPDVAPKQEASLAAG